MRKDISPRTALRGTPYQGLNTVIKNKYDNLSVNEIEQQLNNCRDLLGDKSIVNNLTDNGRRLKQKIQLLDEALIRVQARNVIREKNKKRQAAEVGVRQRLQFGDNYNNRSNRGDGNVSKTRILSLGTNMNGFGRNNNNEIPKYRGLAKNLDGDNLKDLINSIQSMSINGGNQDNDNDEQKKEKVKISKDLKAELYPHQIEGYEWMIKRETHSIESQPYGGIIADEMGLGKTMQMIALLLHRHDIPQLKIDKNNELMIKYINSLKKSQCTLIVCPVSVMDHWEREIKKWTVRGKLIIYKYYGNNRLKNIERLSINYNIIITTYGCIQSEWNEWKKLEDKRLTEMKDIKKQITILQRHQLRYGDINDMIDLNELKKLKIKLQILINKKYIKPILSQILFKRIILDEAHQIKNYKSKTHKAICDLRGKSYWFMTATPIQNTLDDLYAAFHFLKYKYYMNYINWKNSILNHSKGIQRIQAILSVIMLRRLKCDYIDNGKNNKNEKEEKKEEEQEKKLIKLPDKIIITHDIEFNKYERFIYDKLKNLMNKIFIGYQKNNSIGKNFSQCLKMLLQLRMSCNHLLLIKNSVYKIHSILNDNNSKQKNMNIKQILSVLDDHKDNNNNFECSQHYLDEIKNALQSGNDECPLCLDMIKNVSITNCGHRFCTECLNEIIDEKEMRLKRKYKSNFDEIIQKKRFFIQCPVCRKKLKRNDITRIIKKNDNDKNELNLINNNKLNESSSKIKKLMELLEDLHFNKEPNAKCVIFSQWTSMLDIIENELINKKGFGYCRLDGKMTANNRSKSISKLNKDLSCWIMLISLKAGGVGLNLVAANHVFMMDIWWNPAIEDQALDRVHRIGQLKKVKIHRIIIKNSIEQKVLKLQDKKRKIAQQALDLNRNNNNKRDKQSVNLSSKDLIDLFRDN